MTVRMYVVGKEAFSWRHLAKKRKTNVFRLFHIFKENASSSKWKKCGHAIFTCKFLQFSNHSKIKSENLLEKLDSRQVFSFFNMFQIFQMGCTTMEMHRKV